MRVLGIICLLVAAMLSCVAGIYAATNETLGLALALGVCVALLIGVKLVADKR